jgi:RNA 2',3'-cyclic 3'-phosphodiesterase
MDEGQSLSTRWRLFVAAPMPSAAAATLWDSLAGLRDRHPEARWMPAEQYHATLAFLGATDPGRVPEVDAAIRVVAAAKQPLDVLTGEGSGRAGGRRGGVAWLRLAGGREKLEQMAWAVDRAIGSGLYTAVVPPRPHVTVARRVDEVLLADLRATVRELHLPWRVERIVLYRSHTGPRGSAYEELASAQLRSGSL